MIKSKEHYDLMMQFEKEFRGLRTDREKDKNLWTSGNVYQDGRTNQIFKAYRQGYSLGKAMNGGE